MDVLNRNDDHAGIGPDIQVSSSKSNYRHHVSEDEGIELPLPRVGFRDNLAALGALLTAMQRSINFLDSREKLDENQEVLPIQDPRLAC